MVVFIEHIPQQEQAVFTSTPLAEVKETSNLGRVELPEQKAEEIIREVALALKVSKTLVVHTAQQPKHPPSHHTNRPMEYFEGVPAIPLNHRSAVEEGIRLAERLNQERLGGQGKILGVRKSVEGEDYIIYMEVPLEIYSDLDLTTEIEVEVMELSDRLGVPFSLYFVPPGYFG
jgi:hypothetical protein